MQKSRTPKTRLFITTIIVVMLCSVTGCCFLVKAHELHWPGIRARTEVPLWHIGAFKYRSVYFRPGEAPIKFSIQMPDGRILKSAQLTPEALAPYVMPSDWSTDDTVRDAMVEYDNGRVGHVVFYFENGKPTLVIVFAWLRRRVRLGQFAPAIGNRDGSKVFPLPITEDELIELFGEPTEAKTYLFST